MDSELTYMILGILPSVIVLAAWIAALVFAIRMVGKGGGSPEKLLLIGVCLMLVSSLISIATPLLVPLMAAGITSPADQLSMIQFLGAAGIFNALLSLAGIILVVIAFWKKFKDNRPAAASE